MQGMSPLEVKFHLNDIECSLAACRKTSQSTVDRSSHGSGWLRAVLQWLVKPSAVAARRQLKQWLQGGFLMQTTPVHLTSNTRPQPTSIIPATRPNQWPNGKVFSISTKTARPTIQ